MCLLEPQDEVVKLQSFNFWYLPTEGFASFSLQKVPESAGDGGIFPCLFCYAKPGLWIKTKCRSPAIPWNEPVTTKRDGITMELYGENY